MSSGDGMDIRPTVIVRRLRAVAILTAFAAANNGARAAEPAILFNDACAAGARLRVAAVGDLLFQRPLQRQALQPGARYGAIWKPVAPILRDADLTYGNLEGPIADGIGYDASTHPNLDRRWFTPVYDAPPRLLSFNYHPSLIDDLRASGFSVVSTANNHVLDRGGLGIERTIDNLESRGLAFTGTRRRGEPRSSWSVVTRAKGISVAWLACTDGRNGLPDRHHRVLGCTEDRAIVLAEIARLDASAQADAVILTPHWGAENLYGPGQDQIDLAHAAVAAGATAVIGTHPHVLQRWEKPVTDTGREALVIYSTGNFTSVQTLPRQRTGMIALLDMVKPLGAAKARLAAAGYVLTWITHRPRYSVRALHTSVTPADLPAGNRVRAAQALPKTCTDPADASRARRGAAPVAAFRIP